MYKKLTNPEEIFMDDGVVVSENRGERPCPICGKLTNAYPITFWQSVYGINYETTFCCDDHVLEELDGTVFEALERCKKFWRQFKR